ncbi:hypothetical protein FOZ63_025639 [Perkinsus olseni]|uniref:Uncharacterized protein n=1 Tax=Perkinsus olseni TaxID=32597 RepID=A0A7J6RWP5_PEROL|nr:hypothetical protein FOZ63_025639 [Perkinsus olseni]KAF4746012.1 hypothetical protein FOZ62_029696 [Perkinsus olseni]
MLRRAFVRLRGSVFQMPSSPVYPLTTTKKVAPPSALAKRTPEQPFGWGSPVREDRAWRVVPRNFIILVILYLTGWAAIRTMLPRGGSILGQIYGGPPKGRLI